AGDDDRCGHDMKPHECDAVDVARKSARPDDRGSKARGRDSYPPESRTLYTALEPADDGPPEQCRDRGGDEHVSSADPTAPGRDMKGDAGGPEEPPRGERRKRRQDDGDDAARTDLRHGVSSLSDSESMLPPRFRGR